MHHKKTFLKRFWWVSLILLVIIGGSYLWISKNPSGTIFRKKADPKVTDKVIIANPTDLSKIISISKFRSCFGHEFGFTSGFEGQEVKSSLKHYFVWKTEYQDKDNTILIYAAFDGEIIIVENQNNQFLIEQQPFAGWVITYTHVDLQPGLKVGSQVKAGQLVAYAETHKTHAFDIALLANNTEKKANNYDWYNNYESIFNHMSDAVVSQYISLGVTPENFIISKTMRDQSPCACDPTQPMISDSPYCNFPPVDFRDTTNAVMLK